MTPSFFVGLVSMFVFSGFSLFIYKDYKVKIWRSKLRLNSRKRVKIYHSKKMLQSRNTEMWVETEATTPKHEGGRGRLKENLGQNTVKRQTVETEAKSKHSKKTDSRERG